MAVLLESMQASQSSVQEQCHAKDRIKVRSGIRGGYNSSWSNASGDPDASIQCWQHMEFICLLAVLEEEPPASEAADGGPEQPAQL